MQTTLNVPLVTPLASARSAIGAALFHSRTGGFSLTYCTYVLLDTDGNHAAELAQIAVVQVTALNGERFRLRDADEIQRLLVAVGRLTGEMAS